MKRGDWRPPPGRRRRRPTPPIVAACPRPQGKITGATRRTIFLLLHAMLLLVANIFDCMFDSASAIPFEVPTHELRFLRLTVEPYFLKKPITVGFFGETDPSHQSRRVFFVRITHRSRIDDVVHCCPPKHRMADQNTGRYSITQVTRLTCRLQASPQDLISLASTF